MNLSPRQTFWLWAAALGALLLLRLGAPPLFDVDEGAFSEATREMLASGDFGFTTLNGEWRFDKPIGVYWLQAASAAVFGLSEFAVRLPSALSAWGWCVVVAAFAWPRLGLSAALLAGTMLGTSIGAMAIGHAATADALLNLLLTLAGLDLWRYLEASRKRLGAGLLPLRRAFAWIGLGLLVKGPVALLVPGAAALIWVVASRAWRPALRALADWPGWLLLLIIAVPWYAYAVHRLGQAFVDGFLMKHNVDRYTGTLEGHGGSLGYYVGILPMLWLPWSPLLWAVFTQALRRWAEPMPRFLLGWAVFVVAFFSLSGTKLPHYVLYAATPLALLMAMELVRAGRGMRIALAVSLALLLALLAGLPLALPRAAPLIADPLYRALAAGAPPAIGLALAYAAVALIAAPLLSPGWRGRPNLGAKVGARTAAKGLDLVAAPDPAAWMPDWSRYGRSGWTPELVRTPAGGASRADWRRRVAAWAAPDTFAWRLAAGAALTTAATFALAVPWWGNVVQGPVQRAALAAAAMPPSAPGAAAASAPAAVQWNLHQPSFAFYLRRPAPRREPVDGELALVRLDRLPKDAAVQILFQERGFALVRRGKAP